MRNRLAAAIPAALMVIFAHHAVADDTPATEQTFAHTFRQCVGNTQAVVDFNYGSAYGVILNGFEKQNGVTWDKASEEQKVAWIDAATKRMDTLLEDFKLPQAFNGMTMVALSDREEDAIENALRKAVEPLARELNWPKLLLDVDNVRFLSDVKACNQRLQVSNVIR